MEHLLKVLVRPQFALILFFGYSTVGSGSARGGSVGECQIHKNYVVS
jgi:hypothetical protein